MIKKYLYAGGICFILMLCLLLGLSGCHRYTTENVYYATPGNPQQWASNGNAWATNGNATDGNADRGEPVFEMEEPLPTTTPVAVEVTMPPMEAKPTPTPMPADHPESVLTSPEPTAPPMAQPTDVPPEYVVAEIAAGEYNGLSAILNAINDHYSFSSDASVGAKYAAQLLDWYIESGRSAEEVKKGTMGWLDRVGAVSPEEMAHLFKESQFISRLDSVYSIAVTLFGEEGQSLLEAGSYVPANFPYAMMDVDAVFSLIYDAFGERKPQYVRLYRGEEYAGIIAASANKLDPFTLNKALVDADVLANEVSVLYQVEKDGTLLLDFSKAFPEQLRALDREQEEELIRSLVNTIAENLGYESMRFTVGGEPLKTYKTYKDPLTRE